MTNREVNKFIHALKLQWFEKTGRSIPKHAIPVDKYDCDKANGLTKATLDAGKYLGGHTIRLSSEGRYRVGETYQTPAGKIQGKGTWIPGMSKGISDVVMTLNGETWFIEIKIKDRQIKSQKEFESKLNQAGGNYIIIRNFDEFRQLVVNMFNRSSQK